LAARGLIEQLSWASLMGLIDPISSPIVEASVWGQSSRKGLVP